MNVIDDTIMVNNHYFKLLRRIPTRGKMHIIVRITWFAANISVVLEDAGEEEVP